MKKGLVFPLVAILLSSCNPQPANIVPASEASQILKAWKNKITEYHVREDWITEYYVIRALNDFLKGMKWLKHINSGKYHKKLGRAKSCRLKNAVYWRTVEFKFRRIFKI